MSIEKSTTSHIRIVQNGIRKTVDVAQLITDFGLDSSDDDDENFDVQAEVQQMYNDATAAFDQELLTSESEEEVDVRENDPAEIAIRDRYYRWRKVSPTSMKSDFTGNPFSCPPDELPSPFEYFKEFVDSAMIETCVEQTNLYAAQKSIAAGNRGIFSTKRDKVEQFFGVLLYMGILKFPSYTMYWAPSTRIPIIADAMSKNEFEALKSNIHFNDNSRIPSRDSQYYDPLYKIKPFLDGLRNNFLKIEQEEKQSIDEMIWPTKTRWRIRQYIPNKPHKWGLKIFARCGISGMIYDFFVYVGSKTSVDEDLAEKLGKSAAVVGTLCKTLPKNVGHKIYCDNYFTSPDLFMYLVSNGVYAVGTVRSNRLKGADSKLKSAKELQKEGRGSMDYVVDGNSGCLCVVRWFDNNAVNLLSNYVGIESGKFLVSVSYSE